MKSIDKNMLFELFVADGIGWQCTQWDLGESKPPKPNQKEGNPWSQCFVSIVQSEQFRF